MRKIILIILTLNLLSCAYDEIPAGKAIVTKVAIRTEPNEKSRTYIVTLKPLNKMSYMDVIGAWTDTSGFIVYTDSLVTVGDTIDILK